MPPPSHVKHLIDNLEPSELDDVARHFRFLQWRRWRDHLPPPASLPGVVIALYAVLIVGVCLFCTLSKPSFSFDSDDLMNLHESFVVKPLALLRAVALPFTTFNRPTGAVYYRICFDIFGWNPAAFRVLTYLMMMANPGLVWLLARRLTGSMEIGAAAALLYSFHGRLRPLYASNGTVYDVVCALFLLLTLWYYIRVRQDGLRWTWWRILLVLTFYILALNAKEMAAIVPGLLFVFEWLYFPVGDFRSRCRNWSPAAALGLLTLIALWGKTSSGGPFHGAPMYTPLFTLKRFFQNARDLHSQLFYLPERYLSTRQVLTLWVSLFVLPFWTSGARRRALWFSAAFAVLGPLPIIFLPWRWFYVMYVPMIGWAIYFATALVLARNRMVAEFRHFSPLTGAGWIPAQAVFALCLAFGVTRGFAAEEFAAPHVDPIRKMIRQTREDFVTMREPLPKNSRILLLHSRWPDDAWGPLMIARLVYRDPDLWLDRPAMLPANEPLDQAALAGYDRVLDFDGSRLFVVSRRNSGPGSQILMPR